MNHGFKINGNILEITLPDNIHIDKVMVNRQIFSQRMQVCKSCKYHGLEGHEEPCVSCEVGNSNYVPSVEQEERMEERTETHVCDCISRQAAIDAVDGEIEITGRANAEAVKGYVRLVRDRLERLPSAESVKAYTKADYIIALHKEYGCTLTMAEEAHNKALEYLRSKARMKG